MKQLSLPDRLHRAWCDALSFVAVLFAPAHAREPFANERSLAELEAQLDADAAQPHDLAPAAPPTETAPEVPASLPVPAGLVACPVCGLEQPPREHGRFGVHYASLMDQRPCDASWPAQAKVRS